MRFALHLLYFASYHCVYASLPNFNKPFDVNGINSRTIHESLSSPVGYLFRGPPHGYQTLYGLTLRSIVSFGKMLPGMERTVEMFFFFFLFNRPLSLGGHVKSQENHQLCFCTVTLALNLRLAEVCSVKKKNFYYPRDLNMAAE